MTEYDVTPPPERLAERVRIRIAFSTERGDVTAFVVQLEYWFDDEWVEVVRYDHDVAEFGHDVTEEGLHRDVFRDREKHRVEQVTGPIPAAKALDAAEEDLRENAKRYVKRFERWHGIRDGTSP